MPQYARPIQDAANPGSYVTQADGPSDLYATIDETVASDVDYIASPAGPSSAVYVAKLGPLVDPQRSDGHTFYWRAGKDIDAGSQQIDVTVELRQDYVDEDNQGTLIASKAVVNIPAAWTDDSLTLTATEADSISNYSSLFLRFVSTAVA